MLVAVNSTRRCSRSVNRKFLAIPESTVKAPGPTITPFADVPKEPGVGGPNAVRSNQLLTDRWSEGRFGLCRAFGRSVAVGTLPLVKRVFVESGPDHCGVRKKPVFQVEAAITCQPPNARSGSRPRDRNFLPRPNGSS